MKPVPSAERAPVQAVKANHNPNAMHPKALANDPAHVRRHTRLDHMHSGEDTRVELAPLHLSVRLPGVRP